MLKMDDETRQIPVLTYTTEFDGHADEYEAPEPSEEDGAREVAGLLMN
jgi:hypothetical protein